MAQSQTISNPHHRGEETRNTDSHTIKVKKSSLKLLVADKNMIIIVDIA